jgi:hypothetical protein
MGGSLLQLAARGVHDLYLNADPQITMFKIIYRRYVNFSIFDEILTSKMGGNFSSKMMFDIERKADLLHKMYFVVDLPDISIKKYAPTFQYITNVLKSYGVEWNYSPNNDDAIVTLSVYNTNTLTTYSIVEQINNTISTLINNYNFFVNGTILSSSVSSISSDTFNFFQYLIDSSDTNLVQTKTTLITNLTNGRSFAMNLIYNMLQKYMTLYSSTFPLFNAYLPNNDIYVIPTNSSGSETINKVLYTDLFKNKILNNSLLVGSLFAYGIDSLIYNTATDIATDTLDNIASSPLFGNILNRGSLSKSTIIPFNLYTSDDIRYLHYLTFLNNMISIQLTTNSDAVIFNPVNAIILNNVSTNVSDLYLTSLTPNLIPLNESILLYHVLDSDIVNYVVTKNNISEETEVYFSRNINQVYDLINTYISLIPVTYGSSMNTDAYKIFKLYMNYIKKYNVMNSTITSKEQTQTLATAIKCNINNNIIYNFNQLLNVMTLLYRGARNQLNSYILTFYKTYTYSSSTSLYSTSGGSSFVPIINNALSELADNLYSVLNNITTIPPIQNGIMVKNFFNDTVKSTVSKFIISCQDQLKSINYDTYINSYDLWSRVLFQTGSTLLDTYTSVATNVGYFSTPAPIPNNIVFNQIAFMNYIPFLTAKDIPIMVYNTLSTYAKNIFINLGIDLINVPTNYTAFISAIDYRDANDGGSPSLNIQTTKNTIYARIINTIFVDTMTDSSYKIVNDTYFSALKNIYAQGSSTYLLACSLRPEAFLPEYSTLNNDGTLTDISGQSVYLTMEWLTQTYYHVFNTVLTNFINGLSITNPIKTEAINIFQGFIKNIVNCFILHSDIPDFNNYKANRFSLIGLVPETNSTIGTYQQYNSNIITTPRYSDAISSIWYQTQKKFFQMFNRLFNNTLFSQTYYTNNLGNSMGSLFNYIKPIMISALNSYYTSTSTYPIRTLSTISTTSQLTEIYPSLVSATGDIGFDIIRLTPFGNQSISGTNAYRISTYIQDFTSLFEFSINYYNAHKSMLLIKYDADWLYTIPNNTSQLTMTQNFFFDRSNNINTNLNNHENNKYITGTSLSIPVKNDLIALARNTQLYWSPDTIVSGNYVRNTNGVYGILDAIYNSNLTGNMISTIQQINTIPVGHSGSDYINSTLNPFTSFCLHHWYLTISGASPLNIFRYSDLQTAWTSISNILGSPSSPNITSLILTQNKNLFKLYSNTSNKPFPDVSYVTWYVIDKILTSLSISFENMLTFINNTSQLSGATNTINKLNKYFKNENSINLAKYKIISKIINPVILNQINGFDQFMDLNNNSNNKDILYYQVSPNGKDVIKTQLEIRLLNLINNAPAQFAWVKELGHKIIKNVSVVIGGQTIDSHSSELLHLLYKLTKDENQDRGYNIMTGNTKEMYTLSSSQREHNMLYIPFRFWFCKNVGNSLPLINMMYSQVVINVEINDLDKLLYIDYDSYFVKQPKLKSRILAQYMYVDDDERKKIGNSKLEYLIEKYNYNGKKVFTPDNLREIAITDESIVNEINNIAKIQLRIEDSIKYLVWYLRFEDKTTEQKIDIIDWNKNGYDVRDSTGKIVNIKQILYWAQLDMMGIPREYARSEKYFTNVQSYSKMMSSLSDGEYLYSFALFPLIYQPSGSANFTEIGDSDIVLKFTDQITTQLQNNPNLEIVAETWGCAVGVLRVFSGLAGMAFYK